MISLDQNIRMSHNKILYQAYKEFYFNGELDINDGYIISVGNEELYINDIKFIIDRLDVDRWLIKDEFDNIIIMNAYRLPQDENIIKYPCIIEFHGHLNGGAMKFTHDVIYDQD